MAPPNFVLNSSAAAVHAALFATFFILFNRRLKEKDETVTLYRVGINDKVDFWNDQTVPDEFGGPNPGTAFLDLSEDGKVQVKNVILAFFGVTALAHLLYATDFFGTKLYSKVISAGWNPYRWIEYGISASLMISLIAPFSGLRDSHAVGLAIASTAAMQGTGFLAERALIASTPDYNAAIVATLVGWVLLAAAWTAILRSFFLELQTVESLIDELEPTGISGKKIEFPTWLWGIGAVQLAFFSSFGIVQIVEIIQKRSGKSFNYMNIERAYLILSFLAKASLASVLAYGLVGRTQT